MSLHVPECVWLAVSFAAILHIYLFQSFNVILLPVNVSFIIHFYYYLCESCDTDSSVNSQYFIHQSVSNEKLITVNEANIYLAFLFFFLI